MKTIYLRELKSGNFEISNKKEGTVKFKTQKEIRAFFGTLWSRKVIKARYRLSQTYFAGPEEFITFIKKNGLAG